MFKPGDIVRTRQEWVNVVTIINNKLSYDVQIDISTKDIGLVVKYGSPTSEDSFLVLIKEKLVSFHPDNLRKVSK